MGLKEILELVVTMDPNKAITGFESVAKKSESTSERVQSSMSKIGAAGLKLGVGGLAAGAFLTELGSKEQAASQQLEAAIQAVGGSVEEYSSRIDDAVSSGENFGKTAVETKNSLSTLTTAYGDTGQALDRMQLVEDIAAARHISLTSAADLVAKAHAGSSKAFKTFGVQVQLNADGTKNYEATLDALATKLSGQASAATDTWGGKLDALRAKVEDSVAQFGEKYGPAILGVSAGLTALSGITSAVAAIQGTLATRHAAAAAAALTQATAEAEVAAAEAAVTANSAATVASLYAVEGATVASAAAFGPWAIAAAAALALLTTGDWHNPFEDWGKDTSSLRTLEEARVHLQGAGKDTSELDAAIAAATATTDGLTNATDGLSTATDGSATSSSYFTQAMKDSEAATKANQQALKDLHDELRADLDPVFALEKALIDNRKAQADATAAANDGKKSADEKAAADINAAQSALAVQAAEATLAAGLKEGSISMDEARAKLQEMANQGLLTQEQANTLAWTVGGLNDQLAKVPGDYTANIQLNITAAEAALHQLAADKALIGAASGYQGWIDKPTPFLIGEGGEAEYVSVTPKSKMGKGGGGSPVGMSSGGAQTIVVPVYLDGKKITEVVVDNLPTVARRNGNSLAKSISR